MSTNLRSKRGDDVITAYLFMAPLLVGILFLYLIPLFKTISLSFSQSMGFERYAWVGLKNYATLFKDQEFWQSVKNTFLYTLIVVPIGVLLALILAVFLNENIKGKGIFRTLYFLPMMVSPAAVSLLWMWIYNNDFGILNNVLQAIGLQGVNWLTNSKIIIPAISLVIIWNELGYNTIIILAGLQSIPKTYYEVAELDGVPFTKRLFKITTPLLSPTLFFVVTTRIIFTLKQFEIVYIMIDEFNPIKAAGQTMLMKYYTHGFEMQQKGYSSAIAIIILLIILIVTAINFLFEKKLVHYN